MKITKKAEGDKLTVCIEGRLDTATSPELAEELKGSLEGVKEFVFDFTKLEYISSSGLRVLVSTQKQMQKQNGTMVVKNPCELVTEVFEVTGFVDILTIE